MNTNSNSYTIIYASVMVVIVAFLLAFVSSSLKDLQNKNVEMDTKKQILAALNVRNVADPEAEYNKYVKADMLMQEDGTLKENDGKFATSYEKEVKENGRLHVFVCEVDGQTKYVFPVYGVGLWGAYFSHASETPGLGAEIAGEHFQSEFPGLKAMADGQVALDVVKNGKVADAEHQVDGISGGTITSVAVGSMLKGCLGNYTKFLTNKEAEED